jgi:hypothetical protein
MSESVVLRTLTGKSVMWFGKYEGLKVQQIIDLHHKDYIRYIYYNFSGITFTEEVLKEVAISNERVIKKPGTAPEMHQQVFEENRKIMHLFTRKHNDNLINIRAKIKLNAVCRSVKFTKSQLQAVNHCKM